MKTIEFKKIIMNSKNQFLKFIFFTIVFVFVISCGGDSSDADDTAELRVSTVSNSNGKATKVVVGAIRWDAWHTHSTNPNDVWPVDAVEQTLSPVQYRFRAPFFAKVENDKIRIDGYTQAIVDQEIAYAKEAGLDYWAFLLYNERTGGNYGYPMSEALHYYLSSTRKSDVKFCVIETPDLLFGQSTDEIPRIVNYIKEPSYQKVMGNRPLIYLYGMSDYYLTNAKQILDNLRAAVQAEGFGDPYIVIQNYLIADANKYKTGTGANAITRYGVGGEVTANQSPYTNLIGIATTWWTNAAASGSEVVPISTAGYDRRPRITTKTFLADLSSLSITNYFQQPTTNELTTHVQNAIDWAKSKKTTNCPAQAVLIYAWNEHDEGGWLCPTMDIGNGIDKSHLNALKSIVK
jgi:hypothetical protein